MLISPAKREIRSWTTDSTLWSGYKPRAGDIVIGTPAKCGTTWMQQIACLLVFQSTTPRDLDSISPWIDIRRPPFDDMFATIEAQTHRRFLKTHTQLDAIPVYDEVSYIHVARYGLDAFMSWHNHCLGYTPLALEFMDAAGLNDPAVGRTHPRISADPHEYFRTWMTKGNAALLADEMPAERYFDIERSYWAARTLPNLLCVHYNDLKADLGGEMRRIADFLNIKIADSLWPELVEAATFEAMKRNGAAWIASEKQRAFDKGHERFLFKGENARWRDTLTAEEIAQYETRAANELAPGLARWLKEGRLVAGDPRSSAV